MHNNMTKQYVCFPNCTSTTSPHYHDHCRQCCLPSYLEPTAEISPLTITSFGPLVSFSYYVLCFLFDSTNCYFWFLLGFYLSMKWHQDDNRNHSEDHGSTTKHHSKQLLAGWECVQLQMVKEWQCCHPTSHNVSWAVGTFHYSVAHKLF